MKFRNIFLPKIESSLGALRGRGKVARFPTSSRLLRSLCFAFGVTISAGHAAQPNVLFIMIDDLRPTIGSYGDSQAKTPNIDQFASQGLQFDRAYAQVPICGASRASLMTGIYPTEDRFVGAGARADKDAPSAKTIPQVFKERGYTTLANGKVFHHEDDSKDEAWSRPAWLPPVGGLDFLEPETGKKLSKKGRGRIFEAADVEDNEYTDGQVAEKTIADLRELKEQGAPFFLACGFVKPHMPFYAPKKYWDLYERDQIELAEDQERPANAPRALKGSGEHKSYEFGGIEYNSEEWHRMMRHGYLACVSYVDKLVGDILDELDALGLAENTIVVLWGDHGWNLGEHSFWGKHNLMHLSLQVPLIIRLPGSDSGATTSALVETVDLFPTLCDFAGIEIPETVQGLSLRPLLEEPDSSFRDHVYSRYESGDTIVTDKLVYTRYSREDEEGEMLYDLTDDPQENTNVIDLLKYAGPVDELQALLNGKIRQAESALK